MAKCGLIQQGAEARILTSVYKGTPCIIKERFRKKYRHPDLDNQLSKERMRVEVKALEKCKKCGIKTPSVFFVDNEERRIYMEYFENSITAKEFISIASAEHIRKLSVKIGELLAKMHSNHLTHGDLTTSNILIINDSKPGDYSVDFDQLSVALIDFGLALLKANNEDKGVELYVLERALLSTHSAAIDIFPTIIESYKNFSKDCAGAIQRFEKVRARGRKRTMVG